MMALVNGFCPDGKAQLSRPSARDVRDSAAAPSTDQWILWLSPDQRIANELKPDPMLCYGNPDPHMQDFQFANSISCLDRGPWPVMLGLILSLCDANFGSCA